MASNGEYDEGVEEMETEMSPENGKYIQCIHFVTICLEAMTSKPVH